METSTGEIRKNGYVAVNEAIREAGAIVYWRLSGDVDLDRLRQAWGSIPEELLPESTTAPVALRRAVGELRDARTLVRPLEGRKGWAVVQELAHGDQLDYATSLVVKMGAGEVPVYEPLSHPLVQTIEEIYRRQLGIVTQADVSGWLSWLVSRCDAVSLRDTGGVYFVPRHGLTLWRQIVQALGEVSAHSILGIPAMPVKDTIAAVIDAVTSDVAAEVGQMERLIAEGKLGERALESRLTHSISLEEKVARYEEIVGTKLTGVREQLASLQATITTAQLRVAPEMEMVS